MFLQIFLANVMSLLVLLAIVIFQTLLAYVVSAVLLQIPLLYLLVLLANVMSLSVFIVS